MNLQNTRSRIRADERRLALVDKLAAATRRMMFAAGAHSPTFIAIKSECNALRTQIAELRRELGYGDAAANPFFPDMDESKLLVCEDDAGNPYGTCSSCPLIRFSLVLVGTEKQNVTEFQRQFDLHFHFAHLRSGVIRAMSESLRLRVDVR